MFVSSKEGISVTDSRLFLLIHERHQGIAVLPSLLLHILPGRNLTIIMKAFFSFGMYICYST